MIRLLVIIVINLMTVLDKIMDKTSTLSGITIGSAATGTVAKEINNSGLITETGDVFMKTDLLSLLQYSAYIISIIVGILTIISWYRKSSKKEKEE